MQAVGTIVQYLDQFAPRHLAADWDNVGLLLGDRSARVERIMTCLTVTPESANEAIETGAQMIVTHHPILFRPIKRLTTDTTEGKMLWSLIQAGVAVYSPHTAFDNTEGGINDMLAQRLNLTDTKPLRREDAPSQFKIVVFTPESDLANVSQAMFKAGAGQIGEYSECSFRIPGTGTFFGSDETNPTVGQKGRREEATELRLEVVCPGSRLDRVITAMYKAHSYEEVAYDVYPLHSTASTLASGRIGRLPHTITLESFAQKVKQVLNCDTVQIVGPANTRIAEVAIVCGAGGDLFSDAIRARADVFLTGEMRFHDCLRAEAEGVAVCLPGHFATERFALEELANRLQTEWPELQVKAGNREKDPLRAV